MLELLGELAADRIDDVDFAAFQSSQPRALVRNHLEHQPLHIGRLAPILVEGLQYQLDPRIERDEFVGPGTDRRFFEPIVADFFDIFLGHDPAGGGGAGIEGQKIRPRPFELEANVPGVGDFHRGDPLHHQIVRGAAIAFERKFHVLRSHRVAIVKQRALAQREIIGKAVFRCGPRLGKARRRRLAWHQFHHRIVQRIEHHERRDDPRHVGRIEPHRGERHVHPPRQLAVRSCGNGRAGGTGDQTERGKGEEVAASHAGNVRIRGKLVAIAHKRLHRSPPAQTPLFAGLVPTLDQLLLPAYGNGSQIQIWIAIFARSSAVFFSSGVPKGIRTPVTAVKGRCPRPLDDGDVAAARQGSRAAGEKLQPARPPPIRPRLWASHRGGPPRLRAPAAAPGIAA